MFRFRATRARTPFLHAAKRLVRACPPIRTPQPWRLYIARRADEPLPAEQWKAPSEYCDPNEGAEKVAFPHQALPSRTSHNHWLRRLGNGPPRPMGNTVRAESLRKVSTVDAPKQFALPASPSPVIVAIGRIVICHVLEHFSACGSRVRVVAPKWKFGRRRDKLGGAEIDPYHAYGKQPSSGPLNWAMQIARTIRDHSTAGAMWPVGDSCMLEVTAVAYGFNCIIVLAYCGGIDLWLCGPSFS